MKLTFNEWLNEQAKRYNWTIIEENGGFKIRPPTKNNSSQPRTSLDMHATENCKVTLPQIKL